MTWRQIVARPKTVNPMADLAALDARYGAHKTCRILRTYEFRWCVWQGFPGAPKIKEITASAANGGTREIDIKGDPLAIGPAHPARAGAVAAITQQALSVCENYEGGGADIVRALKDCKCIADKVGRAYGAGAISTVTIQVIDRYAGLGAPYLDQQYDCLAKPRNVQAYFQKLCENQFGPDEPDHAWAISGGCACVGERSAKEYLAQPAATANTGLIPNALNACGYGKAAAAAAKPQTAAPPSATKVEGVRPFALREIAGRPVGYLDASGRLTDPVGGSKAANEFQRFLTLTMLRNEPALMDMFMHSPRLESRLAGDNLPLAARRRLITWCSGNFCQWAGKDQFDQHRSEQAFKTGTAPHLAAFAKSAPQEFVMVEKVTVEAYDRSRGGFPLRPENVTYDKRFRFLMLRQTTLKTPALYGRRDPAVPQPKFWRLSAAQGEAVLQHLPKPGYPGNPRYAYLAWTYRIKGYAKSDRYGMPRRDLVLDTLGAALYAGPQLKHKLIAFTPNAQGTIGQTGAVVARAAPTSVGPQPPVLTLPLNEPQFHGRIVFGLGNANGLGDSDNQLRMLNLILIGTHPALAAAPENALFLAAQNIAGLTTRGGIAWAGRDEFQRAAAQNRFKAQGVALVQGLAIHLPLNVIVSLSSGYLGRYNFAAKAFPIRGLPRDPTRLALTHYGQDTIGGEAIFVHLTNGALPAAWPVPEDKARAAKNSVRGGPVTLAASIRLTALRHERSSWLMDGKLEAAALYLGDGKVGSPAHMLAHKIVELPVRK